MAKRIREKTAKRKAERDLRPQATAKYIRISPSKVRIVLDIIRGKDYFTALAMLKNTPKRASEIIEKVLESAGANAENNLNMSKNDLYVTECFADEGQTLKRYWFRSHGRADTLFKRTSHITVILDEKEEENTSTPNKSDEKEKTVKKSEKEEKMPVSKKNEQSEKQEEIVQQSEKEELEKGETPSLKKVDGKEKQEKTVKESQKDLKKETKTKKTEQEKVEQKEDAVKKTTEKQLEAVQETRQEGGEK